MFEKHKGESAVSREERILAFWEKEKAFPKSIEARKGKPLFSFYDGPPFATGMPHYGHLLAGTLKDVVPRYMTMLGYYVPRRFGWDCHGLPIENEIEKTHNLSGAGAIETFGIAAFNKECRSIVMRYSTAWERIVTRMGRWVDFSKTYRTMDKNFMESVWWVFGELYGKGLIYEGMRVMPYSTKLGTPISNFEANLNYKEVDDPAITVKLQLEKTPNTSLLIWTTTPWTLPMNLAAMVKGDLTYVTVEDAKTKEHLILAESRLGHYFPDEAAYKIVGRTKGKDLAGRAYKPLFPYFENVSPGKSFRVIAEEAVSSEEGTGIVHAAPGFGEVDFYACTREGIDIVCPIDQGGYYTEEVTDFVGVFVKDADKEIIKRLKTEGRIFRQETIHHRYPFCWRSDTPLIYRTVRSVYVAVEKIKDRLLAANADIHWMPEHIKYGRFGKWLENARDWSITRNRYWGTPIPIWKSEKGDDWIVIGSVQELEKRTGKKVADLHRETIDELTFQENGETYRRIPDVFDCWFESGSMPYAQNHFPFAAREETMAAFPADYIAEGVDQTRCWFYTLNILSVALFDKPAFKNVIVNGIVLAEDGKKMSKRLKNYPDPEELIGRVGADAIRLYFLQGAVVHAEDLALSERGVAQIARQFMIPLWNSYLFLATYAEIYGWKPEGKFAKPAAEIDQWILSLLQKTISSVREAMANYDLLAAVTPLFRFVDELTDWYIRRNRPRFWEDKPSKDRDEAFQTLYTVLFTFSKVIAPFVPFFADALFLELKGAKDPFSVHLCDYPEEDKKLRDRALEDEMKWVQEVVSCGHALRKEQKLRVRQPLPRARLFTTDAHRMEALKKKRDLISEELNVKAVDIERAMEELVSMRVKPNFRVLGKRVGSRMPLVQAALAKLSAKEISALDGGKSLTLEIEGEPLPITKDDIVIERKVQEGYVAAAEPEFTLLLETELTEELIHEGIAREIIHKVNSMRREADLDVTDRIHLTIQAPSRIQKAFAAHADFIKNEVLAKDVTFGPCTGEACEIEGETVTLEIKKS